VTCESARVCVCVCVCVCLLVRSGPGAARTILLFHTISVRPSKQAGKVGSTLGVYIFALIFVSARTLFLQEQIKDIIINCSYISERERENRSARTHAHDGGLTFTQLHASLKQNLQRMAEKLDKGRG
jgi:hypothetical protein